MSGRCPLAVWRVSGRCLKGVWMESMGCLNGILEGKSLSVEIIH